MHTLRLCPSALRSTIAFFSLPVHCCAQSCFAPAKLSWHSMFCIAAAFLSPPCCAAADLAIVHRLAFAGTANVLFSESPCLSDSSQLSCSPCLCRSLPRFPLRRVRVPAFDSVPLLCASVRCLRRSAPTSSLPVPSVCSSQGLAHAFCLLPLNALPVRFSATLCPCSSMLVRRLSSPCLHISLRILSQASVVARRLSLPKLSIRDRSLPRLSSPNLPVPARPARAGHTAT